MAEPITAVTQPPKLTMVNNIAAALQGSGHLETLKAQVCVNEHDPTNEEKEADKELNSIEDDYPGLVAAMSKTDKASEQVAWAVNLRKHIRENLYIPAITGEKGGVGNLINEVDSILTQPRSRKAIQASLVMQPIDYRPPYKAIWPMLLKKGSTKEWYQLSSGADAIEWESPIEVGTAMYWTPGGGNDPANFVSLTGGKTTAKPFFIKTRAYSLSVFEWGERLIKPIAIKKIQLQMELDKRTDAEVLAAIDAAVPNGTLYSSHATHITADANGAVTLDHFKEAGRNLIHTADSTGIQHVGVKSVALCDVKAIWNLEDLGNDDWSEQTVQEFNSQGFPIEYDSGQIAGMKVNGWSIVQNPAATTTFKIRYVGRPDQVGMVIPVTFQGKNIVTRNVPLIDGSPDFVQINQSNTPPGFEFWIEAFQSMAIVVPGWYNLAQLNQT